MRKFFWILLLVLVLFSPKAMAVVGEKTTVRVGISNNSFSTYEYMNASFVPNGNISIIDMTTGEKFDASPYSNIDARIANGVFYINLDGKNILKEAKGPIVLSGDGKIGIKNLKRKGTPAYYNGIIELKQIKENKFNIINVLSMQDYLKGVVPNEMPVSFGLNALKAQAIAARDYANRENAAYKNYDVCDSTACQVYYGANSETSISNKAVDETLGIYALYDNDIILTLYSSTASGITESYINTYGNGTVNKPYLVSVQDNKDLKELRSEKDLEEYFKEKVPSFDMNSPRYRWEKKFDRFELEEILAKTLLEQSKAGAVFPKYTGEKEFYGLEDIKVLKRGDSYKALEIEIKSLSGNYIVSKELPIRRLFKQNGSFLPSANFIVEKETDKKIEDEIKEEIKKEEKEDNAIFKMKETKNEGVIEEEDHKKVYRTKFGKLLPATFTIYGAGFGHGVGMSQYGAGYLSSYGVSFQNILKHYYKGIYLGTIPKNVSYNEINMNYVQEFYFKKKEDSSKNALNPSKSPLKNELKELLKEDKNHCYLIIENPDKVSNLAFFINDFYFNPEVSGFNKKYIKTEITNFLTDGKNKIIFKPLDEKDKKKTVKFYLIFGADENEWTRKRG